MKILLTGGTGQIGWELQRTLAPLGRVMAPSRDELDLSDPDQLTATVQNLSPDLVVNAAAYTDVDGAEAKPDRAAAVNARAPGILAEAAADIEAAMVHYSTDYVFGGEKEEPYIEDDQPGPINVYGETKLNGERAVREAGGHYIIIRTSWVYGLRRNNFLTSMCRLFAERETVEVVDDQLGSPTWCRLVAEATAVILARWGEYLREDDAANAFGRTNSGGISKAVGTDGLYHVAAGGATSWYGFATAIREELERKSAAQGNEELNDHPDNEGHASQPIKPQWQAELAVEQLKPVSSEQYRASSSRVARRPSNSVLSSRKVEAGFGLRLPGWRESLTLCLE